MSTLSPGSTATTNVFMVLGMISLVALALLFNSNDPAEPASCEERLVRMGTVVWDPNGPIIHPGKVQTVTISFAVAASGKVSGAEIVGPQSDYDQVALAALHKARYTTIDAAPTLRCTHSFKLSIS
jgi:hypothetical protein